MRFASSLAIVASCFEHWKFSDHWLSNGHFITASR
jgi:hypothetical protein